LLDSQPLTAFTMSIFRRLHEYSGRTGGLDGVGVLPVNNT
jgi:hypothetical protein